MTQRIHRYLGVTFLAALALCGSTAASAGAAWPGENGAIVFHAFSPGGSEEAGRGLGIWSSPVGGTRDRFTRLTTLSTDSDPQISPGGGTIAFLRTTSPDVPGKASTTAVHAMAADGSQSSQVTDGSSVDADPTFSASGNRIYFTRRIPREGTNIFSIRLDGAGLRRITSGRSDDREPTVSPSGRLIAFERSSALGAKRRYHHLFVARPAGSRPRDLTPRLGPRGSVSDPDFSPDGRRIAFVEDDRLISIRVDGSSRRSLVRPARDGDAYANPTYSPDGHFLLFSELTPSGRSYLRRFDLRRGRLVANPLPESHVAIAGPAWAPAP